MLKVALISHSPYMAGAERMLTNLAILMRDQGEIEPVVLIPGSDQGSMYEVLDRHGIEWRNVPPMKWYIYEDEKNISGYVAGIFLRGLDYAEALWSVQADVAVVNTITNLESVIGCFEANIPYILWAHGVIDSSLTIGKPLVRHAFDRVVLDLSNYIVTCSDWTTTFYKNATPHKTVQTVHNWTDMRARGECNVRRNRFCALSTLEPHKGIDIIIQAAALLKQEKFIFEVELYAAGSGEAKLKNLARQLNVDDIVKFCGRVTDVQAVYESCIATLMPSFVEPFGMVAIESMAVGTPVIASATGGLTEVIEDGTSGILFPPGEAKALANAMRTIAENKEFRTMLAKNGKERVERFFRGTQAVRQFSSMFSDVANRVSAYSSDARARVDMLRLLGSRPANNMLLSTASIVNRSEGTLKRWPLMLDALGGRIGPAVRGAIRYSKDLASVPFLWYRFAVRHSVAWHGIEFITLFHPITTLGYLIVEVVRNGTIVAQAKEDMCNMCSQTSSIVCWPTVLLEPDDQIELRFACHNATGPVRVLECSDGIMQCPIGSLIFEGDAPTDCVYGLRTRSKFSIRFRI
ncbi:glycosyltransferase [Mycetohabitans endofungorum]|uniref:glycosyltransferase family 4 protein n=1 Tax=Mycetohabitans endofungorum TaxID=417203 RepID=UPI0030CC1872